MYIIQKNEHLEYNINYREDIIISTVFVGKESKIRHNALGWEKNNIKHFKELLKIHPEYFNKSNIQRIISNKAPIVNKTYLMYFPQYKDFEDDKLEMHHIGRDGQVVPLPERLHYGYGEVHNVEKEVGLVENVIYFMEYIEKYTQMGMLEYNKDVMYYYNNYEENNELYKCLSKAYLTEEELDKIKKDYEEQLSKQEENKLTNNNKHYKDNDRK